MLQEIYYKTMTLLIRGADGLVCALITCVFIDLFLSLLLSVVKKNMKIISKKTICEKIAMFLIVGLSKIIDIYLIDFVNHIQKITILFYMVYEVKIILTQANKLELPIPKPLSNIIINNENNNQGD